ncbi:MAG: SRPBCC family protein [Dermatophilaceae bacterium]
MELTHDFTVPADIQTAWVTFLDLETVGGCFPGATVTEFSEEAFSGTVKVKLGPIALQYSGSGKFLERDDTAHRAVIEAKGKDKRGNGTAGATVTMQLAPSGEGTRVDVTTELQVTGKPAQFGRGVMQDVSDALLQQFIDCIESQFDQAPAVEAVSAVGAGEEEIPTPAEVFGEADESETPEPAPTAAPAAPARAAPGRPSPGRHAGDNDAIDLGATVLPVLARTYAPHAGIALLAFILGWLFGRRR